mgnify:CR=1 FL=1
MMIKYEEKCRKKTREKFQLNFVVVVAEIQLFIDKRQAVDILILFYFSFLEV